MAADKGKGTGHTGKPGEQKGGTPGGSGGKAQSGPDQGKGKTGDSQKDKAGYGSTLNPASVQKLVDAISNFQIESLTMIADLRKESEANALEIRRVVEEGKRKFQETMARHARGETGSA